jgi:hypothetical protein
MEREKTEINKVRDAKGVITNTTKIQKIIKDYLETIYSNTCENLDEMDNFLDTYDHPKLN